MSESIPERADIRQLRIQAKELLRTLPAGSKLADAQLQTARKYGFDSWPKLVDKIETPALIEKFKTAVDEGNAEALEKLLTSKPVLKKHVNDPIFGFDSQPILRASHLAEPEEVLRILVRYGADPNIRSKWWAGGFSALDHAEGKTVDVLLELGAKFDIWSAAAKGKIDIVRDLLDKDPSLVNAPGGDGERPLHFASTAEIAELLIERGADLEQPDVDHEGTPIQYQVNNPEILRVLLKHGAKPDIFTAAVLDDVDLARQMLRENPKVAETEVGAPPFSTVKSNGGHIYAYKLGSHKKPHQVAAERGSTAVLAELIQHVSPARRLVVAAWLEDEKTVADILRQHPKVGAEMGAEGRAITDAAQGGKAKTVKLLLDAGVDPMTPGMDSGSALHTACWFGYLDVVRLLLERVPLDTRDAVHGSSPLGWATHGAHWCRNPKGDYVAVVEALLKAGADPSATANKGGTSILDQAGNREDVKEVLRRYGAH